MCNQLSVYKYFRYLNNCTAESVLRLYAVYVLFYRYVRKLYCQIFVIEIYCSRSLHSESHCLENLRTAFLQCECRLGCMLLVEVV